MVLLSTSVRVRVIIMTRAMAMFRVNVTPTLLASARNLTFVGLQFVMSILAKQSMVVHRRAQKLFYLFPMMGKNTENI